MVVCSCLFIEQYVDWWSSLTNDWTYGMILNFIFPEHITQVIIGVGAQLSQIWGARHFARKFCLKN